MDIPPAIYVLGPALVGVGTYWLRAKTDVWRLTKTGEVSAVNAPFTVIQQVLANRDRENTEMRTELRALVMTHLANDALERTALVKSLITLEQSQRELTSILREDRVSAREEAKAIREQLTELRVDLSGHSHRREGDLRA